MCDITLEKKLKEKIMRKQEEICKLSLLFLQICANAINLKGFEIENKKLHNLFIFKLTY